MKQIYIRTFPNGMQYAGQSKNAKNRHCGNEKGDYPVQAANRKYKGRITTRVLIVCEDSKADYYESKIIEVYDTLWPNGYNMTTGGNGGYHFCEESRQKMSEAMCGKSPSDEHRRKLSEAARGRKHSDETRKKISEATKGSKHSNYGKKLSAKTRKKISEARKRMWQERHR